MADANYRVDRKDYDNNRLVFWPLDSSRGQQVFPLDHAPQLRRFMSELVELEFDYQVGHQRVRYWYLAQPPPYKWSMSEWFSREGCGEVAGSHLMVLACPSPYVSAVDLERLGPHPLPIFPRQVMDLKVSPTTLTALLASRRASGAASERSGDFVAVIESYNKEVSRIVPRARVLNMFPTASGVLIFDTDRVLTSWRVSNPANSDALSKLSPSALIAAMDERLAYSISASERAALVARYGGSPAPKVRAGDIARRKRPV